MNVVDLMSLCPPDRHPHGMNQEMFIKLFTYNKPSSSRSTATLL